ncbi:MAG: PEP-CTERM sorting domain-containing protein [Phycisphaerales bacterium]|nr:PEP-CTERM sorting domain-containing protein [Phycisphaerales bacterium]
MSRINSIAIASSFTICSAVAFAGLPNAHTWPMEHIMVTMNGTAIEAHANTSADNPILLQRFAGESYDGNAAALDDMYYSDQYGWILDGIVDPGAGNSIWIELVSQTGGLETYEGGRRMMIADQTFDPIFGTDSSALDWQWSGMMTHNWYATADLGDYVATYSIYVGDSAGNVVDGFIAGEVTLNFRAVPAPGSLALLGLGTLSATRRKRG